MFVRQKTIGKAALGIIKDRAGRGILSCGGS